MGHPSPNPDAGAIHKGQQEANGDGGVAAHAAGEAAKSAAASEADRQSLERAIARFRDQQIAEFFTVTFGLAAEQYPKEMRTALSKVLDLSYYEMAARRMMLVLADLQKQIGEAKAELSTIRSDIDRSLSS